MGNDGGSIPKRRELVKEAARTRTASEVKEVQQEQQGYHWTTCPLSQQALKLPIVSDSLGNLYNKDAVLEFLLPSDDPAVEASKADKEKILQGRVGSLRDVVEVKFHVEESAQAPPEGRGSPSSAKWICPVTNKALGPAVKAVYLVPCGHAFSDVAVKEVSSDRCLQCNEIYSAQNVVSILPTSSAEKERLLQRAQVLKEQGLAHSLKKAAGSSKKRKKNGESTIAEASAGKASGEAPARVQKSANGVSTPAGGIRHAETASSTAKVLAEEQEKVKRRKLDSNPNLKSLFSSGKTKQKDGDFMTRGFSIPAGAKR